MHHSFSPPSEYTTGVGTLYGLSYKHVADDQAIALQPPVAPLSDGRLEIAVVAAHRAIAIRIRCSVALTVMHHQSVTTAGQILVIIAWVHHIRRRHGNTYSWHLTQSSSIGCTRNVSKTRLSARRLTPGIFQTGVCKLSLLRSDMAYHQNDRLHHLPRDRCP